MITRRSAASCLGLLLFVCVFATACASKEPAVDSASPSDLAEAHLERGNALVAKGDLDGALAESLEAVRLKPDLALAHASLARVLRAKGQRVEAAHEIREFLRLTPNTPANQMVIESTKKALRELE